MVDEVTKALIKGDDIKLQVKRNGDRMQLISSSLTDSPLNLRPGEALDVILENGSIVVTRRPRLAVVPAPEEN